LTVTFQDGEPVDPKKLQDLQDQIEDIKLKSDQSYNLSTSTANSVSKLSVMHLDYEVAYVVATPRLQDPKTNNIRWSLSGNKDATKLNVYAEKTISGAINFHWISAGKKTFTAA